MLAAGLVLALGGCKDAGAEQAKSVEAPLAVRVVMAVPAPTVVARSYVGTVRPRYESDLGFRVAGKIIERRVNVGDKVVPGQLIARVDATDLRLAEQAQEAELRAALSSRQQAIAAEGRYRDLLGKGWVADAAFEQRRAAADEARERVERANRSLDVARNQSAYAELRADDAGVVSLVGVETGQVVAVGQLVVRVARLEQKEVVVSLPEQVLDMARAASAAVELWAHAGMRFSARLREVSPEADRTSRTYTARYAIIDANDAVALGMTATVILSEPPGKTGIRLPLAAVTNDGRGAAVWVVDTPAGTVRRQAVEVASYSRSEVLVSGGLEGGELVVAMGTHMLDEGRHVRVVEQLAQASVPVERN